MTVSIETRWTLFDVQILQKNICMENWLMVQCPCSGQGMYTAEMMFSSSPLGSMFNTELMVL